MTGAYRVWRTGAGVKENERSELDTKERHHDASNQGRAWQRGWREGTDSHDAVLEYRAPW